MNESYKVSRGGYWHNKLLRVFLPYALLEFIRFGLQGRITVKAYLLDVFCIQPEYWYIQYLLICYATFWIVTMKEKLYKKKYWILSAMAMGVFYFGGRVQAEQAISFIVGVFISDNYDYFIKKTNNKTFICVLFGIGFASLLLKQVPFIRSDFVDSELVLNSHVWYFIKLFIKVPSAIAIICCTYKFRKVFNRKLLKWMGQASLEIYLVHVPLLSIIEKSNLECGILFIAGTLVCTGIFHLVVSQFLIPKKCSG